MNIGHYAMGFAHYFCAGMVIIMEAPQFAMGGLATLSRYSKNNEYLVKNVTICGYFDTL